MLQEVLAAILFLALSLLMAAVVAVLAIPPARLRVLQAALVVVVLQGVRVELAILLAHYHLKEVMEVVVQVAHPIMEVVVVAVLLTSV